MKIPPCLSYSCLLKLVMCLMSYKQKRKKGTFPVFLYQQLLGVDGSVLKEALTHKKIVAKGEEVISQYLCLFCLSFRFQNTWSLIISTCIWSISRCCVYTVVFMCVWFQMISPLSLEQALSARDSMAKAIYGRAFTWLVQKLNQSLAFKVCSSVLLMRTVLALL